MEVPFVSIVSGYTHTEKFMLDYRNVESPVIEEHHVQFWLQGEFYKEG
jgi:hypothetical protein